MPFSLPGTPPPPFIWRAPAQPADPSRVTTTTFFNSPVHSPTRDGRVLLLTVLTASVSSSHTLVKIDIGLSVNFISHVSKPS